MTAQADPLRNTLDHLALDPKAKEDRKYLVSMLRRLGYSEAEIQEALGGPAAPVRDEARVIEIEYRPASERNTDFRVMDDRFADASGEGVGFSVTPGAVGGPDDQAVKHGWIPHDEHMEFAEGDDGWQEVPADQEWPEADEWAEVDEEWTDAAEDAEPATDPALAEETQAPADEAWADDLEEAEATVDSWDPTPHPEDDGGWEAAAEVTAEEETLEEADGWTQGEWDGPAPEDWEESSQWSEGAEPEVAWDDQGEYQVTEPPAGAWQPGDEWQDSAAGFVYEDYHLYTRMVELSTGREQRIFFFAKNEPKSGRPCPLPAGYTVEKNDRTGLPFLRRDPDAEVVEDFTGQEWQEPSEDAGLVAFEETAAPSDAPEALLEETEVVDAPEPAATPAPAEFDRCQAITKAGAQCKRDPRPGRKFCPTHKGHRGETV